MSSFGLRGILFAIIALAVVPIIVFAAFVLLRFGQSEYSRETSFLESQAQGLANNIDARISTVETMLVVLAAVPALQSRNLDRATSTLVSAAAQFGRPLVLSDADGRILVDTRPAGSSRLPVSEAVYRGAIVVSDVVAEDDQEPFALVAAPVPGVGAPWALSAILTTDDFAQVIAASGAPRDWVVSIVDGHGVHIARLPKKPTSAGKTLVPELVEHIRTGGTGFVEGASLEGIPLTSTVARASRSGWYAAIGLPRRTVEEPVRRNLIGLLLAGAGVILAAGGAALVLARRFDASIQALAGAARALGNGQAVEVPPAFTREVRTIGEALAQASRELAARTAAVMEARADLENKVELRTAELVAEMQRREASDAQLRQLQKIEAVGQLTGGIAHDFNNMLAIVLGGLELLQKRLARGEKDVGVYIERARQGAERAAALTRRLLAFSRQQPLQPQVVDCNRLVADISDLVRRTIPENIAIETVLTGGPWRTWVDANQLENALINLASNARDAMPSGGRLTLETANSHFDDAYVRANPDATAGQYVLVAVTDTGCGMSPDILQRAVEPFFTTKPPGQGTGLGLSQVYGFSKQSGGHLKIYSEVGQGVTVKLYLPRYFGLEAVIPAATTAPPPQGRGELILVVEDEPDVRRMTVEMLRLLGYRAREAATGKEALEAMAELPDLALLLTDIIMPGMNGRQLADLAQHRMPSLKVLFMTGYTRNAVVHNGIVDPGVELIVKPFSLDTLSHKLAVILRP